MIIEYLVKNEENLIGLVVRNSPSENGKQIGYIPPNGTFYGVPEKIFSQGEYRWQEVCFDNGLVGYVNVSSVLVLKVMEYPVSHCPKSHYEPIR